MLFDMTSLDPRPVWLSRCVMLLPLLSVISNYPIIAINLRDNILSLAALLREQWRASRHNGYSAQVDMEEGAAPPPRKLHAQSRDAGFSMGRLPQPSSHWVARCGVGLLSSLPPLALALYTDNIDALLKFTGAFGGTYGC